MPSYTSKFNLYKYNTSTDSNLLFNINEALNNNWDNIDNKVAITLYDTQTTYKEGDCVLDATNNIRLYKSLVDNNLDNDLDDIEFWKEVSLGSGLEVGDIGISLFVDETKGMRRYLNGSLLSINEQTTPFLNRLKSIISIYPSLACTEVDWQATASNSVGGQCGKFVIDEINGTIRLPKIIMPIQGLTNLLNLGEMVQAGLPNITSTIGTIHINGVSATGASYVISTPRLQGSSGDWADWANYGFDASRSSSIYKNGFTTVQQEQIQYPYFIQIANGQETDINITNQIQLNNPFNLFDIKWTDHELNNVSWLRSNGQWNSNLVYVSAYNLLVTEYNAGDDETETIGSTTITYRVGPNTGLKISVDKAGYDAILDATGTAWYYILDLTEQKFLLPQTDGFIQFSSSHEFRRAGLPNITGQHTGIESSGFWANGCFYNAGGNYKCGASGEGDPAVGFDASRCSAVYGRSNTVQPNAVTGYLYFYVGETTQNANLINAGRITEILNDNIITEWHSDTEGYRIWKNGYCEQWGYGTVGYLSITLIKVMANANYNISISCMNFDNNDANICNIVRGSVTSTGFSVRLKNYSNLQYDNNFYWKASGYLAEGEF